MTITPYSQSEVALGESLKNQLARIFESLGWSTQFNYQGVTPSGESWSTDILFVKDTAKVAVFFEWIDFDDEEFDFHDDAKTAARINLYNRITASKVRGLWLGQYDEYASTDVRCDQSYKMPYFYFGSDDLASNKVTNSSQIDIYGFLGGDEDTWVDMHLENFINGLFIEKTIAWSFAKNSSIAMLPVVKVRDCWKCHKPTTTILHVNYYNFYENNAYQIDQLKIDELPERHLKLINDPEYSKCRGIGAIKSRFSRTVGGSYISNGCQHCNSLQGDFFLSRFNPDEIEFALSLEDSINITIEANEVDYGHWFDVKEVFVGVLTENIIHEI